MRPLVAHCHRGLVELYRRTDKRDGEAADEAVARRPFVTRAIVIVMLGLVLGLFTWLVD